MTTGATSYRRGWLAFARLDFDRLARPVLGVAVIASGVLLFHLSRGTSFWADDWTWIATRRGDTVDAFLAPYNGHLSLVPVAIYRLMFAVFGIGSYTPYRALVIALSLVVAVLVFVYARSRVGEAVALLPAASMLFLGPGWQDTMWAFQIPWLIVCAAGIVALMLVERRAWWADAGACALTLLAICSTSLGIAFATGIGVDLALTRRRWRDVWIYAIPLFLYLIWALHYHPGQTDLTEIPTIPLNVAESAAAALSAVFGVSGSRPFQETGNSLTYGWPLVALAAVLVVWRARSPYRYARAAALATTFVIFAASVSIAHAGLSSPLASRYMYVYCLLVLLLATELVRGVRLSRAVQLSLYVVALAAIVANVGALRAFGAYIRNWGASTNGALAGLELDRGRVNTSTVVRIALYQFVKLSAHSYFDAQRALGSPAYTIPQLRHADAIAQSAADSQLLADGDVTFTSRPAFPVTTRSAARTGAAPSVLTSSNGTVARAGACIRFTPAAALAPGGAASVSLIVVPGGLSVTTAAAPATLTVRRFAATLTPLGTVAARRSTIMTIRRDSASKPWYLELSSIAPVRACTLRP